MRISDWSSYVCSSDLADAAPGKLDIKGGVQVVEVEGPAAAAGLAVGDIIVTVNNVDITGPDQYAKVVSGLDKSRERKRVVHGKSVSVRVDPGGSGNIKRKKIK